MTVAQQARLVVWRHGRTRYNAIDRIQGQLDVELDDTGRDQAKAAAVALAGLRPTVIFSSDLIRAAETAAILSDLTGVPVRHDPRLRERSFGLWQGMLTSEVSEQYPEQYARWRAGMPVDGCGVEELDEVAKRFGAALQDAAAAASGGLAVVTGHGGAAKYGVAALLGWPGSVLPTLGPLDNCHWIELRSHSVRGWRMHRYNVGV